MTYQTYESIQRATCFSFGLVQPPTESCQQKHRVFFKPRSNPERASTCNGKSFHELVGLQLFGGEIRRSDGRGLWLMLVIWQGIRLIRESGIPYKKCLKISDVFKELIERHIVKFAQIACWMVILGEGEGEYSDDRWCIFDVFGFLGVVKHGGLS